MPRRKKSKKWIWWLVIFVLLIVAVIVCCLVWDNYFNDKKVDENKSDDMGVVEEIERKEEKEIKREQEENKNNDEDDSGEKKVVQYDGEDPNKGENLTGYVTYAAVLDGKLMIRLNIDQYLGSGTCELNLTKDGSIVHSETVGITSAASTATCEGFDVMISDLTSGRYDIEVKLKSDEKTGVIKSEVGI